MAAWRAQLILPPGSFVYTSLSAHLSCNTSGGTMTSHTSLDCGAVGANMTPYKQLPIYIRVCNSRS